MEKPIVVTSFRGTGPLDAGAANQGDVTLRIAGADETVDIVLPSNATPEVFSAIRGAESELSDVLNDTVLATGTPVFTSITPSHGANLTAVPVVIAGTGFQAGAKVYIGGALCTAIVVVSAIRINCTTAATLATGATHDVVIVNPNAALDIEVNGYTADA